MTNSKETAWKHAQTFQSQSAGSRTDQLLLPAKLPILPMIVALQESL